MVLDDNGMLQADATLLAGLLILLTLLSFKEAKFPRLEIPSVDDLVRSLDPVEKSNKSLLQAIEKSNEFPEHLRKAYEEYLRAVDNLKRIRNILSIVTMGGIVPFSLSAIFIILGFGTSWDLARYVTVAGFVYLIIGVALLVIAYRKVTKVTMPPQEALVAEMQRIMDAIFVDKGEDKGH